MNFISRMGRKLEDGKLVGVHWNAHKKCYSVLEMKSRNTTGLVLGYVDNIYLCNVSYKIDKAKQRAVRNSGVKDRHAFIVGNIAYDGATADELDGKIIYNPHRMNTFQAITESGEKLEPCDIEKVAMMSINVEDELKPRVFTVSKKISK